MSTTTFIAHRDGDVEHQPVLSIARCRRRLRSTVEAGAPASFVQDGGISTPPCTPQSKKRVRFSEPVQRLDTSEECDEASYTLSTGLTPFVSRTSITDLSTISKFSIKSKSKSRCHSKRQSSAGQTRRASLPARLENETIHYCPMRQVLDGRVKRRIARNGLSTEVNLVETEKRSTARSRAQEIEALKAAVAQRDREMDLLRDELEINNQLQSEAGDDISDHSQLLVAAKVKDLKTELNALQQQLRDRSREASSIEWTLAARDPYDHVSEGTSTCEDADNEISGFGDSTHFDEIDLQQLESTPTRLKTHHRDYTDIEASFPSPPATLPNTPCKPSTMYDEAVQTSFLSAPDQEAERMRNGYEDLKQEVMRLKSSIAYHSDTNHRILSKLSNQIPTNLRHSTNSIEDERTLLDAALDNVLTNMTLTLSSLSDSEGRFGALKAEILALGFYPQDENLTSDPSAILKEVAKQFRDARIELERLLPGETTEGFNASTLIKALLSHIEKLATQVRTNNDHIDEYHEQETLLRQQINTRVEAMDELQKRLARADDTIWILKREIEQKDTGHQKMSQALERYGKEVTELHDLIESMEDSGKQLERSVVAGRSALISERLKHDTTRAALEGKNFLVPELIRRLDNAIDQGNELAKQVTILSKDKELRDEALHELQGNVLLGQRQLEETNDELEEVHEALRSNGVVSEELNAYTRELEAQIFEERRLSQLIVTKMQTSIGQALETGVSSLGDIQTAAVVTRQGRYDVMDADATEISTKRRRYDSGLSFLDEVDMMDCQ